MRIAIAAESKDGLDGRVSPHFGRCPCFVLIDVEGQHVAAVESIDNPYHRHHASGQVPALIHSQNVDVMLAGGMGRRAIAHFGQYGIEAVSGASGTVGQALSGYLDGELQGVEPCADSQRHHTD
jgi:predicted Fe-Mo cluster-binding NifX family protein